MELSKYVVKCGDSWYVKRITRGPYELRKNGITHLREIMLSESDKLNGIEYRGVFEFFYSGPQRQYGFISENTKGWSEWYEDSIAIDIWIQKKGGVWKAELTDDIFRGSTYIMITCNIVPGRIPLSRGQAGRPAPDIQSPLKSEQAETRLVQLDQELRNLWTNTETVYQRRADLVPNLLTVIKTRANIEKETFDKVIEAKSKVGQVQRGADLIDNPEAFSKFQAAQDGLTSALSRLIIVIEKYPELKTTQNFRDLQVQLEQTENRITVERMRYNEAALEFNRLRISSNLGLRFKEKAYLKAQGEISPPKVKF